LSPSHVLARDLPKRREPSCWESSCTLAKTGSGRSRVRPRIRVSRSAACPCCAAWRKHSLKEQRHDSGMWNSLGNTLANGDLQPRKNGGGVHVAKSARVSKMPALVRSEGRGDYRGITGCRTNLPVAGVHGGLSAIDGRPVLPGLSDEPPDSSLRKHCRSFHDTLIRWMEIAPALVINRCAPMASNSSKPYQAQLIREHGFLVPQTLITNDPDSVREFRAKHGRVIYKSISAVRSIVQELSDEDEERLD